MHTFSKYKFTLTLVFLNFIFFFIFFFLSKIDVRIPLYFSAWKYETGLFAPYQLISYQFIHASLSHLFLNLLVFIPTSLYLENILRTSRVIYYFLISGIIGGAFHILLYQKDLPLVGASGSIWGLSVILAFTCKSNFIKFFIFLSLVSEIYKSFTITDDGVAHFCHVGGAIGGLIIYLLDRKSIDEVTHIPGV